MGICLELKGYFSCYVPNYKFNPKFKARIWNGQISFFDVIKRTLPIGLFNHLKKFCEDYKYELVCKFDNNIFKDNIPLDTIREFSNNLLKPSGIVPHEHQIDAIYTALNNKRGIIVSPTASGKSFIIYAICRFLLLKKKKCLIVVPSTSLCYQLVGDFKDYCNNSWNVDNHTDIIMGGFTKTPTKKKYKLYFDDGTFEVFFENEILSTNNGKKSVKELKCNDIII
jgi:hypothetical protein